MSVNTRPSAHEVVTLGKQIYERDLRSTLESDNIGRYIAIDVRTSDYEVGDDRFATVTALRQRRSEALVCTLRIGYDAAVVMGGRAHRTDRSGTGS